MMFEDDDYAHPSDPRRTSITTRDGDGRLHSGGRQIRAVPVEDEQEERATRGRRLDTAGRGGQEWGSLFRPRGR